MDYFSENNVSLMKDSHILYIWDGIKDDKIKREFTFFGGISL